MSFQISGVAAFSKLGINRFGDKFNGWEKIDDYYLDDENLLKKIDPGASYIAGTLPKILGNDIEQLQKARDIYRYVRDSFRVSEIKTPAKPLKQVFEEKTGDETNLNLLFQSLLKAAGIRCYSIALSTIENVKLSEVYPIMTNINYLATLVHIDDSNYVADPSEKYGPFGMLSRKCYNGYARVVDADWVSPYTLNAGQLLDKNRYVIFTGNVDDGNYTVNVKHYYGDVTGAEMRKAMIMDTGNIRKEILKELPAGVLLTNYKAVNLYDIDERLVLDYSIKVPWSEGVMQIQPIVAHYYSENPFKSTERCFPVELPFAMQTIYDVNLKLPQGYKLIDAPVSVQYDLGAQNKYRYTATYQDSTNTLRINTTLLLKDTYFDPSTYSALKSFFDKMLELQQTTYTFKKQ